MRVADCMTAPVQVVGPDAPAWEALGLMRRHHIRRLPVVDAGDLVGIVTWTDVVRVQPPAVGGAWQIPNLSAGVLVRHLMTPAPLVVGPDDPVEDAAALMRRHKIGGLPVVADGRLVGIVTESDLFELFVEQFGTLPDHVRVSVPVASVAAEVPRLVAAFARQGVAIAALYTMRLRGRQTIDLEVPARDVGRARDVVAGLTRGGSP